MIPAVFLVFSAVLFLDILLRMHGITAAVVPFAVFYYTVLLGWKKGMLLAVLSALCIIFLTGEAFPFEFFTYPAVSLLALFWLYRTESDSLFSHAIPGVLIPLILYLPRTIGASADTILHIGMVLPPLLLVSAVMLPLFILLLDSLAEKFAFPIYSDVKLKIRHDK